MLQNNNYSIINFTGFFAIRLLFNFFLVFFFSFVNLNAQQKDQTLNKLSAKETDKGWVLLFNGKTLEDWKVFNGGEVTGWKIIDGILHNSGIGDDHGGDIITKKKYQDFILYIEWNVSPMSNSGIFIRAKDSLVNAIYKTAPEYQISDDIGIKRERTTI